MSEQSVELNKLPEREEIVGIGVRLERIGSSGKVERGAQVFDRFWSGVSGGMMKCKGGEKSVDVLHEQKIRE